MKKIVFLVIITCALAVSVFAQSYNVQSVKGRVQQETGANRSDVKEGNTLQADALIHTGVVHLLL